MALETGIPDEGNEDATLGGLSAYNDANVRKAMEAKSAVAKERQKYYDELTAKLTAQRAGPSFSERMYQLSSALFAPTSTRGLSGVMGNVLPVLQKQQQAQREGEITRQDALQALTAAQLKQRESAAEQDVATELSLYKLGKQGSGPGQWSEKFGRFIPKDRPVPIKVGVLNGRRIVTLTDGTSKLYGVGGNPKAYEVLDAAGNVIGQETE